MSDSQAQKYKNQHLRAWCPTHFGVRHLLFQHSHPVFNTPLFGQDACDRFTSMPILKIDPNDPQAEQKELEFEVRCALQVNQSDRIHKQLLLSQSMLKLAKKYADQRPYQIIKRPCR